MSLDTACKVSLQQPVPLACHSSHSMGRATPITASQIPGLILTHNSSNTIPKPPSVYLVPTTNHLLPNSTHRSSRSSLALQTPPLPSSLARSPLSPPTPHRHSLPLQTLGLPDWFRPGKIACSLRSVVLVGLERLALKPSFCHSTSRALPSYSWKTLS
jgi:hypothetical protein